MTQNNYVKNDYVAIIADAHEVDSAEELKDMLKAGERPENSSMFRYSGAGDTRRPRLLL